MRIRLTPPSFISSSSAPQLKYSNDYKFFIFKIVSIDILSLIITKFLFFVNQLFPKIEKVFIFLSLHKYCLYSQQYAVIILPLCFSCLFFFGIYSCLSFFFVLFCLIPKFFQCLKANIKSMEFLDCDLQKGGPFYLFCSLLCVLSLPS